MAFLWPCFLALLVLLLYSIQAAVTAWPKKPLRTRTAVELGYARQELEHFRPHLFLRFSYCATAHTPHNFYGHTIPDLAAKNKGQAFFLQL